MSTLGTGARDARHTNGDSKNCPAEFAGELDDFVGYSGHVKKMSRAPGWSAWARTVQLKNISITLSESILLTSVNRLIRKNENRSRSSTCYLLWILRSFLMVISTSISRLALNWPLINRPVLPLPKLHIAPWTRLEIPACGGGRLVRRGGMPL